MQRKHLTKSTTNSWLKTLSELGIKVNFLNLIEDVYKKLPANIIHKCEKHVTFPLRSEQDMDVPRLTTAC